MKSFKESPTYLNQHLPNPKVDGDKAIKTEPAWALQMDEPFEVETKEGPVEGKAGDYLMMGNHNEMWPIDQAIFDDTYKFVKEGSLAVVCEEQNKSLYDLNNMTPERRREMIITMLREQVNAGTPTDDLIRMVLQLPHDQIKKILAAYKDLPRWAVDQLIADQSFDIKERVRLHLNHGTEQDQLDIIKQLLNT